MGCGKVYSVIHILGSGKIAKLMVTGCISGRMETGTKVLGSIVSSMGRAQTSLRTKTYTRVPTLLESLTGAAYTNGKVEAYTPATSARA